MVLDNYKIISLLQKQVTARPDETALTGYDTPKPWDNVSWRDFGNITNTIGKALIDAGMQSQDNVVILSNNCPQWTCVDIGVLKARGVVVPVYPTSTLEQAAYIINDCQAKWLFVAEQSQYDLACQLEAQCSSLSQIVVFNDDVELVRPHHQHLADLLQMPVSENCEHELAQRQESIELDDLLTIIYTSGTTGDPKGVMLSQRNFAAMIRQHKEEVEFSEGQVSLAFLPLSHVFERGWSYYVLGSGGQNVYLSDTHKVKEAIAAVKPHVLCVVPRFLEKIYSAIQAKLTQGSSVKRAIFNWATSVGKRQFTRSQNKQRIGLLLKLQHRLANKLVFEKLHAALGGRIKFMPCGGAALDKKISAFFASINLPVLCGYGMTETTATVACNTIDNRKIGSNGTSLSEVELRLGANNEIQVRGNTVMQGYYNRPQETAETFEDGWLKTGDAGEFDADGNLFITDRIKELMKTSNGKYIAPQRVEGVVGCCPFIDQVAIIADARNYVTALIVPAFDALESWAKQTGLHYESPLELLRNSQVVAHFEERLKQLQVEFANFEKIKKFTLLPEAFSLESGLITPTLKLKRKMIYTKYSQEINEMYG